ncbi:hypothetical protein AB0395_48725, partial [Streptosporangium sp. NPDC051023]|uniref:hypothetical protein n=1 Tax=Streptosporangium sp. NPDC051023 TaxID=3155410 RepID=UPI00344F831A
MHRSLGTVSSVTSLTTLTLNRHRHLVRFGHPALAAADLHLVRRRRGVFDPAAVVESVESSGSTRPTREDPMTTLTTPVSSLTATEIERTA